MTVMVGADQSTGKLTPKVGCYGCTIRETGWTLAMTMSQWKRHKHCPYTTALTSIIVITTTWFSNQTAAAGILIL